MRYIKQSDGFKAISLIINIKTLIFSALELKTCITVNAEAFCFRELRQFKGRLCYC